MYVNKKQELKSIQLPDAVWKSIGILFVLIFVGQIFLLLNQERQHLYGIVERTLAVVIDSVLFLILGIAMFVAPVQDDATNIGYYGRKSCNLYSSRRKAVSPNKTRVKETVTETLNADGSTTVKHELVNSDGTKTVCVVNSLF